MFYLLHSLLFSTISNEKSLNLHHGFPVYSVLLLNCYQDFLFIFGLVFSNVTTMKLPSWSLLSFLNW